MNVPTRILGIATSIFWIVLIAFIATAAYSIKDLSFSLGEPEFTAAPNRTLLFSLPLHISNNGYSTLNDFNITTAFYTVDGSELSSASTFVPTITQGQNITIYHNATLNMDSLLGKEDKFLFNDSNLTVSVTAALNFATLIPTQLSTNITYPWGAPLNNFALGQPSYELASANQSRVTIPMSFENHAQFNLAGNIKVQLYDSANSFLGETQTPLNVPPKSPFTAKLEFNLPLNGLPSVAARSGHLNVFFSTQLFDYGPTVITYG